MSFWFSLAPPMRRARGAASKFSFRYYQKSRTTMRGLSKYKTLSTPVNNLTVPLTGKTLHLFVFTPKIALIFSDFHTSFSIFIQLLQELLNDFECFFHLMEKFFHSWENEFIFPRVDFGQPSQARATKTHSWKNISLLGKMISLQKHFYHGEKEQNKVIRHEA